MMIVPRGFVPLMGADGKPVRQYKSFAGMRKVAYYAAFCGCSGEEIRKVLSGEPTPDGALERKMREFDMRVEAVRNEARKRGAKADSRRREEERAYRRKYQADWQRARYAAFKMFRAKERQRVLAEQKPAAKATGKNKKK